MREFLHTGITLWRIKRKNTSLKQKPFKKQLLRLFVLAVVLSRCRTSQSTLGAAWTYRRVPAPEKDRACSKDDHGKSQTKSGVIRCWGAEHHFYCSFSTSHSLSVHYLPSSSVLAHFFQCCARKGLEDKNDANLSMPLSISVLQCWM